MWQDGTNLSARPRNSGLEMNCSPASIVFSRLQNRRDMVRSLIDAMEAHEVSRWLAATPEVRREQVCDPPDEGWRTWVLLGGRGSGKTFAGGYWINQWARGGPCNLALVGPAFHDVREVMIEGPSGLRALAGPDNRPRWEASRRRLVWPTGAAAYAFSAEDPDSLRGPQFHAAWADEFCAWREPEKVLSNLRFGLRLGDDPKLAITTTPRPIAALRRLLAETGVVTSRLSTRDNEANLAPGFLGHLRALYAGTRLEAQEMEGLIVEADGALFRARDLAQARGSRPVRLEKIVVAVDPPVTAHGDACGIVVCGRRDGRAYVLGDGSVRGMSPAGWAAQVVETAAQYGADLVLAEANQGGEMVRTLLAQAGCPVAIKLVHAGRSKKARAEPVAALYEQGRVVHCGAFAALEEELMALGSEALGHSPDRADALVWAVTHLLLAGRSMPRLRSL